MRPSAGAIPANTRVAEVIQQKFPEHDFEIVDVQPLVRKNRAVMLLNAIYTIWLYRGDLIAGRKRFWACFWRTPFIHRSIKRILGKAFATGGWDFTFQMQSLFDGSLNDVPHFVYTDHTHLANLDYPDVTTADLYHPKWIECEREVYFNASTVFVRSTNMYETLLTRYQLPKNRALCVYAGANADVPVLATSISTRDKPKKILFVGGDWERKGGPDLLEAFRQVRKQCPQAELTIVSSYTGADTAAIPGVKFVGRVPLDEVSTFFEDSDIFCLPTRLEPFGIVFIEAMAYGLPIVATRIGALPDLVDEGINGYLIEPGDVPALAEALIRLFEGPVEFSEMAHAARCRYDNEFNWDAVFSAMKSRIQSATRSG